MACSRGREGGRERERREKQGKRKKHPDGERKRGGGMRKAVAPKVSFNQRDTESRLLLWDGGARECEQQRKREKKKHRLHPPSNARKKGDTELAKTRAAEHPIMPKKAAEGGQRSASYVLARRASMACGVFSSLSCLSHSAMKQPFPSWQFPFMVFSAVPKLPPRAHAGEALRDSDCGFGTGC